MLVANQQYQNDNSQQKAIVFEPKDQASELMMVRKFRKKLLLSKIFYAYVVLIVILGLMDEYLEIHLSEVIWLWLFCLFIVGAVYSIVSAVVLGKCPYCHQFRKINAQSILSSNAVSPFVSRCNRCGAPLSEKAVNDIYAKIKTSK